MKGSSKYIEEEEKGGRMRMIVIEDTS